MRFCVQPKFEATFFFVLMKFLIFGSQTDLGIKKFVETIMDNEKCSFTIFWCLYLISGKNLKFTNYFRPTKGFWSKKMLGLKNFGCKKSSGQKNDGSKKIGNKMCFLRFSILVTIGWTGMQNFHV